MRVKIIVPLAAFLLVVCAAAYAGDRPHEGKITRIDPDVRVMTIQGENGDQWDLYWTETTKLKGDVTVQELREGDSVHFDYVERDGKKWVTELRRTRRAEH